MSLCKQDVDLLSVNRKKNNKKIYIYCTIWFHNSSIPQTISQGPVVQRFVSLTCSLVIKMLNVLVSTISNAQVFLLKNVSSFCKCKSYSHFFSKNISIYVIFNDQTFNDTLTNDIVSFEQLGPGFQDFVKWCHKLLSQTRSLSYKWFILKLLFQVFLIKIHEKKVFLSYFNKTFWPKRSENYLNFIKGDWHIFKRGDCQNHFGFSSEKGLL